MKKPTAELNLGIKQIWPVLGFAIAIFGTKPAQAVLPIPDQVFYGTIAIHNQAITNNAAGTNVLIEAHRSADGQLLASYRMGSATSQGQLFYVLRIPMEDAPASSVAVAEPEDTLTLIVKRANNVQFSSNNVPLVSGVATRIDFGVSVDTDRNGVPDAWELAYFGTSGGDLSGDRDHDGVSDYAEYVAGTSPTDPNDVFQLSSTNLTDQAVQITFIAKKAQGIGYEGRTRYYALELATNGLGSAWETVPYYTRIPGSNQSVLFTGPTTNAAGPVFFRGRVWLEGP